MRVAFLMPGQGSQAVGMGASLAAAFPEARARIEEADRILGRPLSRTMFEGPEEALRRTEETQPALFTVSCAATDVLAARGLRPFAAAGHSVGEYAALYAAGALDFETGLRLVDARAAAMGRAAVERPGGMAAILGMEDSDVEDVCAEASAAGGAGGVVVAANFNAPGQVVISGERAALDRAVAIARAKGAKSVPLNVAGPWHSPLMEGAARALAPLLAEARIDPPEIPVVANVTADVVEAPGAVRAALEAQVAGAVRWAECVRRLASLGADLYLEVGTGHVLKGLVKRIERGAKTALFGTAEDLDAALAAARAAAA